MTRPVTRRGFLGLAAGVALVAACGRLDLDTPVGQTGELLETAAPLPPRFTVPLPLPAVARPVDTSGGVDRYEITQRVVRAEVLPGIRTTLWTYDGTFPGPTIEARHGRPVVVGHRNQLPVPTVVHLHGGHTPAAHDGWPLDLVLPEGASAGHAGHGSHHGDGVVTAGTREYRYSGGQRAATLWYHDHRMDFTGPAVYRGLTGFHLLRDDAEDALPLPRGERELPLLICDRAFDGDGELIYPARDSSALGEPGVADEWMEGVLGDVVLVNGAPWPVHEVDAARYRLRLLNAANARRFRFVLEAEDGRTLPFTQIGSDLGLLAAPQRREEIDLAPAERCDVVADLSTVPVGSAVTLIDRFSSGGVLRFVVARRAADDSRVPNRLAEVEVLRPGPVRREFVFEQGAIGEHAGWTVNGTAFDPATSLADVPLGQVETWRFRTDVHHPVHVHLDGFQVLRRGAGGPSAADAGWKDTVDVRPREVVEVAVRFTDHAGRFVLHCHNLEHEDMAMMAVFRTV